MNFVVAELSKVFDSAEKVFLVFTYLFESVHSIAYFDKMAGLERDLNRLSEMTNKLYPGMCNRLERFGISLRNIFVAWLVCLFTNLNIDSKLKLLLLEFIIINKKIGIFKVVLFIVHRLAMKINENDDDETISRMIKNIGNVFLTDNLFEKIRAVQIPTINYQDKKSTGFEFFTIKTPEFDIKSMAVEGYFEENRGVSLGQNQKGYLLKLEENIMDLPKERGTEIFPILIPMDSLSECRQNLKAYQTSVISS